MLPNMLKRVSFGMNALRVPKAKVPMKKNTPYTAVDLDRSEVLVA